MSQGSKIYKCNNSIFIYARSKPQAIGVFNKNFGFKPKDIKITNYIAPMGISCPSVLEFDLLSPNIFGCPGCCSDTLELRNEYFCTNNHCYYFKLLSLNKKIAVNTVSFVKNIIGKFKRENE